MAEHEVRVEVKVETLRRADGLIFGARATLGCAGHKALGTLLWWLNRDTDDLEELRPYRVGMRLKEKRR